MTNINLPLWSNVHTIAFDFDGVFTDNTLLTSQFGDEVIKCSRSDGLAFDILRRFIEINQWDLEYFVISTETNPVVQARCQKIGIKCFQSVSNKLPYIKNLLQNRFGNNEDHSQGLIYLGNDLNDLKSMQYAGFSVAPSDAHDLIKDQSNLVLSEKGGEGFVRSFIEKLLRIDNLDLDYLYRLI